MVRMKQPPSQRAGDNRHPQPISTGGFSRQFIKLNQGAINSATGRDSNSGPMPRNLPLARRMRY